MLKISNAIDCELSRVLLRNHDSLRKQRDRDKYFLENKTSLSLSLFSVKRLLSYREEIVITSIIAIINFRRSIHQGMSGKPSLLSSIHDTYFHARGKEREREREREREKERERER